MSGHNFTGTFSAGVILNDPTYNPVTVSAGATITNPSGVALQSTLALDWTIGNSGLIQSTGTTYGATGIALAAGGTITNSQVGRIAGYDVGVSVVGTGTVINQGSITASQTTGSGYTYNSTIHAYVPLSGGVVMGGGIVSNATSAVISGNLEGVALSGGGSVVNAGSISGSSTAHGFGVFLPASGNVSNAATGTITGGRYGILTIGTNSATVTNHGVIAGQADAGVFLLSGGIVSNDTTGTISGGRHGLFAKAGSASTVVNQGLVAGGSLNGVYLYSLGLVSNAATGTITGGRNAVFARDTLASTVVNQGLVAGGTLTGVYLKNGGIVSNAATGTITGPFAVAAAGTTASTVTNAGTIVGTPDDGVYLVGGGYVSNAATGTITSGYFGVRLTNAASSVVNLGSIASSRTFTGSPSFDAAGVDLAAGGTVTNGVSGKIRATWKGVEIGTTTAFTGGTLLNQGFVYASNSGGSTGAAVWIHGVANIDNAASGTIAGGPFGVVLYSDAKIVNRGSITGTEYAIFEKYAGDSVRLINYPGAFLSGLVEGSSKSGPASGILELASGPSVGTIAGFGSKYVGFSNITLDASAAWSFGGTVTATQHLAFNGANASLALADPRSMAGTITGFAPSDTIALTGITDVTSVALGANNVLTVTESIGPPITLQFDPTQDFSTEPFTFATIGGGTNLSVACFAAGTRILTEQGLLPVETLRPGMRVRAHFSGSARVVWLGHRHIDCRRHATPSNVWPIRIRAGAFAPGQPAVDLDLSPDHAIFLDGVLIPVRHLVNGTTIRQRPADHVAYYHVELPHHDVLLAEGLPVESYLDTGDRANFANSGETIRLFADFAARTLDPSTTWDAKACAPLVIHGPAVEAARRAVNGRAASVARKLVINSAGRGSRLTR